MKKENMYDMHDITKEDLINARPFMEKRILILLALKDTVIKEMLEGMHELQIEQIYLSFENAADKIK